MRHSVAPRNTYKTPPLNSLACRLCCSESQVELRPFAVGVSACSFVRPSLFCLQIAVVLFRYVKQWFKLTKGMGSRMEHLMATWWRLNQELDNANPVAGIETPPEPSYSRRSDSVPWLGFPPLSSESSWKKREVGTNVVTVQTGLVRQCLN